MAAVRGQRPLSGRTGSKSLSGRFLVLVGSFVIILAGFLSRSGRLCLVGRSFRLSGFGLSATPAAQQSANADTSGATLAQLETEVNELKAVLRTFGLIAT